MRSPPPPQQQPAPPPPPQQQQQRQVQHKYSAITPARPPAPGAPRVTATVVSASNLPVTERSLPLPDPLDSVSYTHLRAHETEADL
eukprot:3454856-Rhodomonas_salina.1